MAVRASRGIGGPGEPETGRSAPTSRQRCRRARFKSAGPGRTGAARRTRPLVTARCGPSGDRLPGHPPVRAAIRDFAGVVCGEPGGDDRAARPGQRPAQCRRDPAQRRGLRRPSRRLDGPECAGGIRHLGEGGVRCLGAGTARACDQSGARPGNPGHRRLLAHRPRRRRDRQYRDHRKTGQEGSGSWRRRQGSQAIDGGKLRSIGSPADLRTRSKASTFPMPRRSLFMLSPVVKRCPQLFQIYKPMLAT